MILSKNNAARRALFSTEFVLETREMAHNKWNIKEKEITDYWLTNQDDLRLHKPIHYELHDRRSSNRHCHFYRWFVWPLILFLKPGSHKKQQQVFSSITTHEYSL